MKFLLPIIIIPLWAGLIFLSGCEENKSSLPTSDALFQALPASYTGVEFQNDLHYDRDFNIYTYRNFYNGGGVGIADLNQDGKPDLYFTGNMESNRLYLNLGDFKFKDITEEAGVKGEKAWATGVSLADVNGDGLIDIYVCNSGDIAGDNKQNELFINQGNNPAGIPTFVEEAEKYGLADRGFSTHAAFFDYDRDGDLDCYLLNNSYRAIGSFNLRKNERPIRDEVGGDKLFRNEGDRFVDVSEEAHIYGSAIGFGLGVTVGDVDQDGWQDIYVSNDFFERDYLYLNQQDGTFQEVLTEQFRAISAASMGADMADLNQDGAPEIFVTDMLPEPDARLKQVTTFEDWNKYQLNLRYGFYHQFTRNMLHLNNGDGSFSEVSRMAGVEATDWSWGALLFDMDNDGLRDLFIANGIYQDLTDQDYLNFASASETKRMILSGGEVDYKRLIDSIPSRPVPNYAYRNMGFQGKQQRIPSFEDLSEAWGFSEPSFSNGSAYGDLDGDGDLDLVINNVNMPAAIYRSEAVQRHTENHWIKINLTGSGNNPFAIGSKLIAYAADQTLYLEHMPMRGFQSTMDYGLQLGLGETDRLDSLKIIWPDHSMSLLTNVASNQTLDLSQSDASLQWKPASAPEEPTLFTQKQATFDYQHQESRYSDFDRNRLLYQMRSSEGPCAAAADINNDGLTDIYLGGAKDQAGELWLQQPGRKWLRLQKDLFETDQLAEDVDALFFDANQDGRLDLYVASGGVELPSSSSGLRDRLYLNQGGRFVKSPQTLPSNPYQSSSCVTAADFDGDGDQDLFVGARLKPFNYGVPASGFLLENDGQGQFKNVSDRLAPELADLGMITDASWGDLNGDQVPDLMVVGEWMAPEVFINQAGKLVRMTEQGGLSNKQGWWTCLEAVDLDQDGDLDFVVGNHGLNSRFTASDSFPIQMAVNDFDGNGQIDPVMYREEEGKSLPYVRLHDLSKQMPILKRKYLRFSSYAGRTMEEIFNPQLLEQATIQVARELGSAFLLNDGQGHFTLKRLPAEAQVSTLYGILAEDFDGDGHTDLLLGGNQFQVKPEMGRYDASYGLLLQGDGKGNYEVKLPAESGLRLEGAIRQLIPVKTSSGKMVMAVRNDDELQVFSY